MSVTYSRALHNPKLPHKAPPKPPVRSTSDLPIPVEVNYRDKETTHHSSHLRTGRHFSTRYLMTSGPPSSPAHATSMPTRAFSL